MQRSFVFLFTVYSLFSFGQNRQLDSLKKLIESTKEDTVKVLALTEKSGVYMTLGEMGKADTCLVAARTLLDKMRFADGNASYLHYMGINSLYKGDYPVSRNFFLRSVDILKGLNKKMRIANELSNIGVTYDNTGDYDKAKDYYLQSLKIHKEIENKIGIGRCLSNIGIIYYYEGNYRRALENYYESLKVYEENNSIKGIAEVAGNIGVVLIAQHDYKKAMEYELLAMKNFKLANDKVGIASTCDNLGMLYGEKNMPDSVIYLLKLSKKLRDEIGDPQGIARSLANEADFYFENHETEKGIALYNEAISINEKIGDKVSYTENIIRLGYGYCTLKQYPKAIECAKKGLVLAKEVGVVEGIRNYYGLMSDIYEAWNKKAEAYDYYRQYIIYRDSLKNDELTKNAVTQQMNYDFDKRRAEEKLLNEKKEAITTEELKRQKTITYASIGGIILVFVLLLVSIRSYRNKQKANEIITQQKAIVDAKQKEIIDSIKYAQHIQRALITNERYIEKSLNRLQNKS